MPREIFLIKAFFRNSSRARLLVCYRKLALRLIMRVIMSSHFGPDVTAYPSLV